MIYSIIVGGSVAILAVGRIVLSPKVSRENILSKISYLLAMIGEAAMIIWAASSLRLEDALNLDVSDWSIISFGIVVLLMQAAMDFSMMVMARKVNLAGTECSSDDEYMWIAISKMRFKPLGELLFASFIIIIAPGTSVWWQETTPVIVAGVLFLVMYLPLTYWVGGNGRRDGIIRVPGGHFRVFWSVLLTTFGELRFSLLLGRNNTLPTIIYTLLWVGNTVFSIYLEFHGSARRASKRDTAAAPEGKERV
jgi:hypothetical protein